MKNIQVRTTMYIYITLKSIPTVRYLRNKAFHYNNTVSLQYTTFSILKFLSPMETDISPMTKIKEIPRT